MNLRSIWFRFLLLLLTFGSWAIFIWMTAHTSLHPVFLGRYSAKYLLILVGALIVTLALTVVHWPPIYARMYQLRFKILLLMFSFVFFGIVLTEGLIRAVDLFGADFYGEVTRYMKDLVPDKNLIFRQRPGLNTTYEGVKMSFNEIGLRDRPIPAKPPDEKRILFLGDSVTLGWGTPVEDTYTRLIETQLTDDLHCKIRTINSGVCGYNTKQELTFLKEYGDTLKPDVVILTYVNNDVEPSYPIPPNFGSMPSPFKDPAGTMDYFIHKSWVYRILYHITRPATIDKNSPGWRSSMASLSAIAAYCRERGIPFVTFLFRMTPDDRSNAELADISQLSSREHFLFSDMLPWFAKVNVHDMTVSLLDVHPNARGHKLIADEMTEFLLKNGVVCKGSTASTINSSADLHRPNIQKNAALSRKVHGARIIR